MKLRKYMLVILILATSTYYLEGMATSQDDHHHSGKDQPSTQQGEAETRMSGPLYVPGDYLKAAMVAGQAFQENIDKKWRNNPSPVAPHLSNISDYSIAICRDTKNGQYKIEFSPKPFQDSPIKGGGATYVIDSKSFKILNKDYSM